MFVYVWVSSFIHVYVLLILYDVSFFLAFMPLVWVWQTVSSKWLQILTDIITRISKVVVNMRPQVIFLWMITMINSISVLLTTSPRGGWPFLKVQYHFVLIYFSYWFPQLYTLPASNSFHFLYLPYFSSSFFLSYFIYCSLQINICPVAMRHIESNYFYYSNILISNIQTFPPVLLLSTFWHPHLLNI